MCSGLFRCADESCMTMHERQEKSGAAIDFHGLGAKRLGMIRRFRASRAGMLVGLGVALMFAACHTTARFPIATSSDSAYAHGAVAADHPVASQAGLEMLRLGGNAVDAAVATSFCLSVVRPESCGIGGGGFMLIFLPATDEREARCVALNYRETAPSKVGPDYFVKLGVPDASECGAHAVGVPGTVAGLCHALKHYGTLDLPTVLGPAIRAAEHGVRADATLVESVRELEQMLAAHPNLAEMAAPIWRNICDEGHIRVGDVVRQRDQARALKLIAQHGPDAFYKGEIAQALITAIEAGGGPMTLNDLAAYSVTEMEPLHGDFWGHEVFAMPPPSSGGVAMLQAMGIIERRWKDVADQSANSADSVHLVTEAFKHAFADRAEWLGDSAFVEVPVDRLLDYQYLNTLAARVSMDRTLDPFSYGSIVSAENPAPPPSDSGTSHLCVIDATGMAVACTETINLNFGSLMTVPGFGIVLNDEMDDFTTRPGEPNAFGLRQSIRNSPQAGKRPLSSMSPTIMVKDGRATLITGASGGPRIITGTTQCILNCTMFNMTPERAVNQPRFHHQWLPNTLLVETQWTNALTLDQLVQRGHVIESIEAIGQVQMIVIDENGIRAASDPRKGGAPAGY
jgi:gamma-glutamyltranspeptidase/glutathione hydrolase